MTAERVDSVFWTLLMVVNVVFYIGLFSYIGYNVYQMIKRKK